jgi:hypothetical protein
MKIDENLFAYESLRLVQNSNSGNNTMNPKFSCRDPVRK